MAAVGSKVGVGVGQLGFAGPVVDQPNRPRISPGVGGPLVSFARATRGLRRPSLDARSRRPIRPPFNSKWKAKAVGLVDDTRVVELTNPKEWEQ